MQVTSQDPFPPFHGLQTVCKVPFPPFHGLQTACEGSFSLFHGLQTICEGSFSPFHGLQTLCEGVFFILSCCANCLRGSFSTLSRCANPEQRSPLPPCTSCKAIAGGFSPYSPTLPTAGNQLFPFVLYPDYSNPLPSVKGKSPENPKKAPFLLFPRHPHCQNPSLPPAWTQGGLATTTMPQGEKQESRP